jgi:hypothetical protein
MPYTGHLLKRHHGHRRHIDRDFNMQTSKQIRHQTISKLSVQQNEKFVDAAIVLWQKMATEIISIVGVGGFNSLYTRSVFFAQVSFPFLSGCTLPAESVTNLADLKKCLACQNSEQACAANTLLLITFTDILASIIGDQLTNNILQSAWGVDVPENSGKELKQ